MKLTIAIIIAGLCTVASVDAAKKRPIVCLEFTESTMPVDGVPSKVAICTDRKKPTILTEYTISTVKDDEGKSVRAAIGYR